MNVSPKGSDSAESSSGKVVKSSKDISLDQGGHINFFKDIEAGLQQDGKNKEHEAEKKAEQEKWEKNMGLLTYLGQSAVESQNDLPWYLKKSELKKDEEKEKKKAERRCGDEKHKASQDPLLEMRKHLDKRHKHKHTDRDRELRAERLRREMAEKQKIAAVVARARGENVEETDARDTTVLHKLHK
nr:hypothetical protein BaRGS_035295 [Batillaria attramentaria]